MEYIPPCAKPIVAQRDCTHVHDDPLVRAPVVAVLRTERNHVHDLLHDTDAPLNRRRRNFVAGALNDRSRTSTHARSSSACARCTPVVVLYRCIK